MERQILLAVDGSDRGLEATSILGSLLKDEPDYHLLLFHCVQELATLYPREVASGSNFDKLSTSIQQREGDSVLQASREALLKSGFPKERIEIKLKLDSSGPAQDILAEAEARKIRSIACGRRGRTPMETLVLGSVSSKLAQYSQYRTVWVVDSPVHQSRKVLIAMEGAPDSRSLTYYTAEFIAPIPHLEFTILHVMPPVSPTFWDDGHILGPEEQKERQSRIMKWESDWRQRVEKFMSEARHSLIERGVPPESVEARILKTKEGVARDILNEIAKNQYQIVVMGKRSFNEKKPFHLGSNANKILHNAEGAVLCMVDS